MKHHATISLNRRIAHHFNEHELRVLTEVCQATGDNLGKLTIGQAEQYLALFYTVPHKARTSPNAYLAQTRLLELLANTLPRFEFQRFDVCAELGAAG